MLLCAANCRLGFRPRVRIRMRLIPRTAALTGAASAKARRSAALTSAGHTATAWTAGHPARARLACHGSAVIVSGRSGACPPRLAIGAACWICPSNASPCRSRFRINPRISSPAHRRALVARTGLPRLQVAPTARAPHPPCQSAAQCLIFLPHPLHAFVSVTAPSLPLRVRTSRALTVPGRFGLFSCSGQSKRCLSLCNPREFPAFANFPVIGHAPSPAPVGELCDLSFDCPAGRTSAVRRVGFDGASFVTTALGPSRV